MPIMAQGTQRRAGVPAEFASLPMRTVTSALAASVYARPAPQLARMAREGVLHRVARGYYVVVPAEHVGSGWIPTLEAAAAGIGAADFGPDHAILMGLSAARMHGALPRAIATAIVAVPRQRAAITIADRDSLVRFVVRHVDRLDVESMVTELGRATVTTPEQTVLDLARRPSLGGAPDEARAAAGVLLPRCDRQVLERLAIEQHMRATLIRLPTWAK